MSKSLKPQKLYEIAVTGETFESGESVHGDLGLDRLVTDNSSYAILSNQDADLNPAELKGVDAVISMAHAKFDKSLLSQLPDLRHIARFGAGYDTIDLDTCTAQGILVTNAPDAVAKPVAQATLTLLLATAHNLIPKDQAVRDSQWSRNRGLRGIGLSGKTLGIIGMGNIGAQIAAYVQDMGLRIIANNRSNYHSTADMLGITMVDKDQLVQESDFIVLCASLNSDSHHLLSTREFKLMKNTTIVVNVGRGKLIDTDALLHALTNDEIAGAGLDVFDPEPLPEGHPIFDLENVTLSPHALSWTDEYTHLASSSVVRAVHDLREARKPRFMVNPEALEHPRWEGYFGA